MPLRNLITDVPGLTVGNAHDEHALTGVTVVIPDRAVVAAADVRGGGPGTREVDALGLAGCVDEVHAIVLSGGSALGLGAATGVQSWLAERDRGFKVREARVPIVPQAILFDLLNGGDKNWGRSPPYERLALQACEDAASSFGLGSAGAGFGATTANFRGGLGSASALAPSGAIVGALVAVNAVGSVTIGDGPHFWAAPFERGGEFGGYGSPATVPAAALAPRLKGEAAVPADGSSPPASTTLAVVATNARLCKRQAHRLAVMAHTGMARAIDPVHTPLDGDIVFALATGDVEMNDPIYDLARLGALAAHTLARAIARAVYEAASPPAPWTGPPPYRERHPGVRT